MDKMRPQFIAKRSGFIVKEVCFGVRIEINLKESDDNDN
jgi:hypothetical protein